MLQSVAKAASSLVYTFSVFVKAAERTSAAIWVDDGAGNGAYCVINLSTGVLSQAATLLGAGWSAQSASVQTFPNGWYRVQITATSNTALSVEGRVNGNLDGTSASQSYLGDITKGFYAWGAQLEQAAFASSYIPTTTVAVTRNADVLSYVTSGNANASSATIYGEITRYTNDSALADWFSAATGINRWEMGTQTQQTFGTYGNGTTFELIFPGAATYSANSIVKCILSFSSTGGGSYTQNGLTASHDAVNSVVILTANMYIGTRDSGNNPLFGTIRNVRIWTTQLTDTKLQALTA